VKVLALRSAKGLEFPIVAIAGLRGSAFGHLHHVKDEESALNEALKRERRTLFVALTRAMRALLVITPRDPAALGPAAQLLAGFDETLWNTGQRDDGAN
jgi:superfamily I DNA/RNA helicase